jgi:hypothetical protein
MIEFAGIQIGAAGMALTGAAIGWALRPLFVRYRRAFVAAALAVAAVGAVAYDVLGEDADAPRVASAAPAPSSMLREAATIQPASPDTQRADFSEYLETAGNAAYDEGDYAAALRYWRAAGADLPAQSERGRNLAAAIARTQRQADAQR